MNETIKRFNQSGKSFVTFEAFMAEMEKHMPIDSTELDKRFTYHTPKENQPLRYTLIRNEAKKLAATIINDTPECREQSLAITAIEQAVMWANAAIARRE